MPAAVVAIGAVIGSVASAVASVVAPIAAMISAAVGPAVAAIGSVLGTITSALGAALAPIGATVSGIAKWVVTSLGQTVGSLVETVAKTTKPFLDKLGEALGKLAAGIDQATKPILEPIRAGLKVVYDKVKAIEQWVSTAFHPSARMADLKAAHPELWAQSGNWEPTFVSMLEVRGLISSTEATLVVLPDVMQTINQVATLKVLADLVKGQASISDLIGKIADGKSFETAQAVAELSKSIVTTTVGIMDRVDTEVGILRSSIDSFDEHLRTTLVELAGKTKAEILAVVTPKMEILGRHQLMVTRQIAKLTRHIEDESWFMAMLLKALA